MAWEVVMRMSSCQLRSDLVHDAGTVVTCCVQEAKLQISACSTYIFVCEWEIRHGLKKKIFRNISLEKLRHSWKSNFKRTLDEQELGYCSQYSD
jgi:predicted NUDIX family NTP pyrophosphohydrolase